MITKIEIKSSLFEEFAAEGIGFSSPVSYVSCQSESICDLETICPSQTLYQVMEGTRV